MVGKALMSTVVLLKKEFKKKHSNKRMDRSRLAQPTGKTIFCKDHYRVFFVQIITAVSSRNSITRTIRIFRSENRQCLRFLRICKAIDRALEKKTSRRFLAQLGYDLRCSSFRMPSDLRRIFSAYAEDTRKDRGRVEFLESLIATRRVQYVSIVNNCWNSRWKSKEKAERIIMYCHSFLVLNDPDNR